VHLIGPTLQELMTHAPPELGFSMELKFDVKNPLSAAQLDAELGAILAEVRAFPGRRITFSSFDPDAALRMRELQDEYPVMMISPCRPEHADPRLRSVEVAMEIALDGDLHGLVVNIAALSKDGPKAAEEVAEEVRASGLLLGTYGVPNECPPVALSQVEWGMCLVCTDNVPALAKMFNGNPSTDSMLGLAPGQPTFGDIASSSADDVRVPLSASSGNNSCNSSTDNIPALAEMLNGVGEEVASGPSSPSRRGVLAAAAATAAAAAAALITTTAADTAAAATTTDDADDDTSNAAPPAATSRPASPPAALLAFPTDLGGGVVAMDLVPGRETGATATEGDLVRVRLKGRLFAEQGWVFTDDYADSEVVDSAGMSGVPQVAAHTSFTLGAGDMIAGLEVGVAGMLEGGVRRVVIPPMMSYQSTEDQPVPRDPANRQRLHTTVFDPERIANGEGDTLGTVIFDIELLRVDGSSSASEHA